MKLSEITALFEMPQEINATEFNLDDDKVNAGIASKFKVKGKRIEIISNQEELWQWGNRIALIIYDDGRSTKLIYFVQWKVITHPKIGKPAIAQVSLWADKLDPRSSGIAEKIFWSHLLPLHEVLITDALQTPDGQRFWRNRLAEAFKHHLFVYYLNLLQDKNGRPPELIEIVNLENFARLANEKEFWGLKELHRARKIIISSEELKWEL